MTELEKMQRAKMYIDKMADGIDPISDTLAAETDVINNVRISRCLFYVSDILQQVINNGGTAPKAKREKQAFFLTQESIKNFPYSKAPILISDMAKRLNSMADLNVCHRLKNTALTAWLVEIGALEIIETQEGKTVKRPTEQGMTLGISVEGRVGRGGEYLAVVYNSEAQRFLVDNLESIVARSADNSSAKADNQGRVWTTEQEILLRQMFEKGETVAQMSLQLKRTGNGIRAKLKKLGLIDSRDQAK